MQLLGRYLSPFVRRTATTLNFYGIPFENVPLQHTGDDAPKLRKLNPVGRVPALVLDNDEVIIDSAAIIDYLDRQVGPERALTPPDGKERDRVLSLLALGLGSVEKAIACAYEIRFRPEEKRHQPWVERCEEQCRGGMNYLNEQLSGDWFVGNRMTQADVSIAVCWQFMSKATPDLYGSIDAPNLSGLVDRMMRHEAFSSTLP